MGVDGNGDAHKGCRRNGYLQLWDCPACGQVHKRQLPCLAKDCHHCQEAVTKRRGARRHGLMGGRGIMAVVVTLPRSWAPFISGEMANTLRKEVAHRFLAAVEGQKRVQMGCTVAVHPCGDLGDSAHAGDPYLEGDPMQPEALGGFAAWGPHFHITAPLAGLRDGRVVQVRGFDAPRRGETAGRLILALRATYQEMLDRVARDLGMAPAPANVHYRYMKASEPQRVGHRLRYDLRTFPDWSASDDKGLRKALIVRGYGLLGPQARCPSCAGNWGENEPSPDAKRHRCKCGDAGLEGWRRAIAYQSDEGEGLTCRPCWEKRKTKVRLTLMTVTSEHSWLWSQLKDVVIDLDRDEGEGAERAQGPPA